MALRWRDVDLTAGTLTVRSTVSQIDGELKISAPKTANARSLLQRSKTRLSATNSLAGVTVQLVTNDPQVRKLLRTGPGFAQEVSRLAMIPFCTTTRSCTTACRGLDPTSAAPASAR